MPEPDVLKGTTWLVLEKRGTGRSTRVVIVAQRQNEPRLERGQRALRVAFEIDAAIWMPQPTPGTTIQVHAPVYPDPVVLASEWPQTPLTERPTDEEHDDEYVEAGPDRDFWDDRTQP